MTKIGHIKAGLALRRQDEHEKTEAEYFLTLLKSEWTDTISSNALNTLKRNKGQKVSLLPVTADLRKLREYHTHKIQELATCIDDYAKWRKLAVLVLSRLTIFNKRRGGEASKLLLEAYSERPDWSKSANEEILSTLQPLERKLLQRVHLVMIPGKRNRKVPMLITPDVKKAMDVLIKKRHDVRVGIPETNPYLFASRSVGGHLSMA